MTKIHHINCGYLQKGNNPKVQCHCLLLEEDGRLALVDTGIGQKDIAQPQQRIGQELIDRAGFCFDPKDTARAQILRLGLDPEQVKHCLISHFDPDHIGGLADFPTTVVHVSGREWEDFRKGNHRYREIQLAHDPCIRIYKNFQYSWFGFAAERLEIGFNSALYLLPLPGHTMGHCGIAIEQDDKWVLYTADAYYLKAELHMTDHPITAIASMNAMDDELRVCTLVKLRQLLRDHGDRVEIFGYHDPAEFPQPLILTEGELLV